VQLATACGVIGGLLFALGRHALWKGIVSGTVIVPLVCVTGLSAGILSALPAVVLYLLLVVLLLPPLLVYGLLVEPEAR
jgi:hypothetical protein